MSRRFPTKGEDEAYWCGYRFGQEDAKVVARYADRVAAFGAIRRAVGVARWHDSEAASWKALRNDNSEDYEWCADQIRRAIRAAIGSDKS